MLNSFNRIQRFLGAFFMALFCFLIFNNSPVNIKAVTTDDVINNTNKIDDGYKTWNKGGTSVSNSRGSIPISNTVSLDYTFGSARTSTGAVSNQVDPTVLTDTSAMTATDYSGAGYYHYSKINVFINNGGKYYSIVHQGKNSFIGSGGSPENASDSSMDFGLANGTSNQFFGSFAVTAKMTCKVIMYALDANNRKVIKLAGYLNSGNGTGSYAEVVLRPSITGAPIVQRELYIYNPTSSKKQFQTYFGEDTALNSDSTTFDKDGSTDPGVNGDDVPLYAIGGGQGLYINSGKSTGLSNSKLFVTNNVADGFKDFMGIAFSSPYSMAVKGKAGNGSGADISSPSLAIGQNDTGDTARPAGSLLLYGKTAAGATFPVVDRNGYQNSAYTLRWANTDLLSGQTAHFASTIGATISPYAIPVVTKTYTNSNQVNGVNHVGDTLHFKLKVDNQGLNSNWSFNKLVDNLPQGLQLNPSSVKYTSTYFNGTTGSGDSQHDIMANGPSGSFTNASTSQLNVTPEAIIKDKGTYTVTFDATVTLDALSNLSNGALTNTATFTGNNKNANGTNLDTDKDYTDSVKIPIAASTYVPTFTKTLRNNTTNAAGAFSKTATAKKGDTIEYKVQLSNTGTDYLKSANFSDVLPAGLTLVEKSVTLNGTNQDGLSFSIGPYNTNTPIVIDFKATVTSVKAMTASNIAVLNNIKTNAGQTFNNYQSNAAVLNIAETAPTMSIVHTPTVIDFGSINSDGSQRMLTNIRTNGRLVITHTNDTPFNVTVAYDNDGVTPLSTHDADGNVKNKLVQTNDDALYFNQDQNNNKENWTPVLSTGIPIKSDNFSGVYNNEDLTSYIGTGKWKLLIPAASQAGHYEGTITWGIADTPQ